MAEGAEAVSTSHSASMSNQQLFSRTVLQQLHTQSELWTYYSCSKDAQDMPPAQQLHSSCPLQCAASYVQLRNHEQALLF